MIQALIPLGLRAVEERLQEGLQAEVTALAGRRYAHGDDHPGVVRWGRQPGSIFLADQKLPLAVPRVRDSARREELELPTYEALETPRSLDAGLFRRVLGGLSCRDYEAAAEAVPEAFGLKRSSVSRRFIRSSARELRHLQERSLGDEKWIVLLPDGKTFRDDSLVIALGVTATGKKRVLGGIRDSVPHDVNAGREVYDYGHISKCGAPVSISGKVANADSLRVRRRPTLLTTDRTPYLESFCVEQCRHERTADESAGTSD